MSAPSDAPPPRPLPPRGSPAAAGSSGLLVPALVAVVLTVGASVMVVSSLRRPEVPTWPPTPPTPREVGAVLDTGTVTVDASAEDRWTRYDFSRGSVVVDGDAGDGRGWDLAFHRFGIIVNGGPGFPGRGGALALEDRPFAELETVPADGYQATEAGRDSVHAALGDWYAYGFTTHLLTPRDRTYAVRTADGRFAKVRILSYYCPGGLPGCVTFRYAYQGGGGRRVVP